MLTLPPANHSSAVMQRYARYGVAGGLFTGLLAGVLAAGPQFHVWPAGRSIAVVLGLALLGGLVGRLAAGLVSASALRGSTEAQESEGHSTNEAVAPHAQAPGASSEVAAVEEGE